MRGFRGSRAAQNSIAQNSLSFRHGQGAQTRGSMIENQARRPVLPDWLKTAETRQQEKQNGGAPALPAAVRNTIAHMARSFAAQPQAGGQRTVSAKVIPLADARKKRAAAAPAKKRAPAKAKPARRAAAARPAKRKAA
jgi:hypothetical protein